MENKVKPMGNNRPTGEDKGGKMHRHSRGYISLQKPHSLSGRFCHVEPLDKISDSKSKAAPMRRPKTHPELLRRDKPAFERTPWLNLETPPVFSRTVLPLESANIKSNGKLLVNVTVAQSIGPLRVLISTNVTVMDVIKAALAVYAKEGRRPILSSDPLSFGLHYSQFTIDCLNPDDKMKDLGSRNFFVCPKAAEAKESNKISEVSVDSCGTEMEKFSTRMEPWYKLMDCFLPVL